MRLWSYSLRELRRRPARTVLTLLGLVIGVGAFVSIGLTARTAREATHAMFDGLAGKAELEIVAAGGGGFDAQTASEVADTHGVRAAVPLVVSPVALLGPRGPVTILALGIDPAADRAARELRVRAGVDLDSKDGALLPASFAESQGLSPGDRCALVTATGLTNVEVAGLLEPGGAASFNGGALVILRLERAQALFGLEGQVNALQLVLVEGADPDAVANSVRARLAPGLELRRPAARSALAGHTLRNLEQPLGALSVMALVAGAFIILNTFLMSVSERRRQLALLRALGTTRAQLTRLLLRESLVLGMVGTVLGLGIGIGAAHGMLAGMELFLGVTLSGLKYDPGTLLLGIGMGPALALLATWIPARRAGRRPVLPGLFPERAVAGDAVPRWLRPAAGALVLLTFAVALGFVAGHLSGGFIAPAMAFVLVACTLSVPVVVPPLLRVIHTCARPVLGVAGRLAFRQLERYPLRTSLTSGVLALAVITGVGMGNATLGSVRDIEEWYARTIVADYLVRAAMPTNATMTSPSMARDVGAELAAVPGVERVLPLRFLQVEAGGETAVLMARGFDADQPLELDLVAGAPDELSAALLRGEAVLSSVLAHRLGLEPGDRIELATPAGPHEVRVAGLVTEYTAGGMALYMEWAAAEALYGLRGVDVYMVDAPAAAEPELRRLAARHGLMFQTNADLRAFIDELVQGTVGLYWTILVLVLVVACLGVVNTLSMHVLEQRREIGLLRAVAMTRGQIKRFVGAQALALAAVSLPPGALAGVAMAYAMYSSTYAVTGVQVEFHLELGLLAGALVLAAVAAWLAAWLPARHAARVRIAEALAYE